MKSYLNERGFNILGALDKVSAEKKVSPTQVAIAWLNHHKSITAALASATNLDQLSDLLKGAQLKLSQEELNLLNQASSYS